MPIQQIEGIMYKLLFAKSNAQNGGTVLDLDSMIQLINVVIFIAPFQLLLNKLIVMIAIARIIWNVSKCVPVTTDSISASFEKKTHTHINE